MDVAFYMLRGGQEAVESQRRITNARHVIIPNAVSVPERVPEREWQPHGNLRLVFLGRLHPIKGIENLLRALAMLGDDITLMICGSGEPAYTKSLKALAEALQIQHRIKFVGHVEGDDKSKILWRSDICIVPSFTENFAMVVAEALGHSLPVICGKGTPWRQIEGIGAGCWVDNSPESLAAAVKYLERKDLKKMGQRGRAWIQESYVWGKISDEMLKLYAEVSQTKIVDD